MIARMSDDLHTRPEPEPPRSPEAATTMAQQPGAPKEGGGGPIDCLVSAAILSSAPLWMTAAGGTGKSDAAAASQAVDNERGGKEEVRAYKMEVNISRAWFLKYRA